MALGVTGEEAVAGGAGPAALAETPGFESVDISVWSPMVGGPARAGGVKLRAALAETLKSEQFRAKMQEAGGQLAPARPGPGGFQADETKKYGALVKAAKIEAQ